MTEAQTNETTWTGAASWYAPGLMRRVYENQRRWRDLPLLGDYIDGVALMPCRTVGLVVDLEPPGGEREGPFLVVDCATGRHFPARIANGDVVEVSYETARRWEARGLWNMRAGPLQGVKVYLPRTAADAGPCRRLPVRPAGHGQIE